MKLWYNFESQQNAYGWENEALPIGNGFLAAKVYGGINYDEIQINEQSLWSGGPKGNYTFGNDSKNHVKDYLLVQNLIAENKIIEAEKMMEQLQGNENRFGDYQNVGSLIIQSTLSQVTNYHRELDLTTAIAKVSFCAENKYYQRSYYANYPSNVIVVEYTSENDLDFTIHFESMQQANSYCQENQIFVIGNKVLGKCKEDENDLKHTLLINVLPKHAVTIKNNQLCVKNIKNCQILITCVTNYQNKFPHYRKNIDTTKVAQQIIHRAMNKNLKQQHVKDYQKLFNTVNLQLTKKKPNITTDELLKQYPKHRLYLETLYYQYGRYLMIASSRKNSLPANLQGKWNCSNHPAWQSDYHLNINLQMNYSLCGSSNLLETYLPLIEYVQNLVKPGRITAKKYMGVNGWITHTQNNIFGNTGPGSNWQWGYSPTAGAWILIVVYEYYLFSKDVQTLKQKIYPTMYECAKMWSNLLIPHKNRLVVSPTYSPEHGPVSAGATYDQSIVYELFQKFLHAQAQLNIPLDKIIQKQLTQIQPLQIGKHQQLKEWLDEDEFESDKIEKHHRHLSHLIGVWPNNIYYTKKQKQAIIVSLQQRENSTQGWSIAQKIGLWARLGKQKQAYQQLQRLLMFATLKNLWNTHPPFQIDGNFGSVAAMNEFFVQSHTDTIQLLKALPYQNGYIHGIRIRGNHVCDIDFQKRKLVTFKLFAYENDDLKLQYKNITQYAILFPHTIIDKNTIQFKVVKNQCYVVKK